MNSSLINGFYKIYFRSNHNNNQPKQPLNPFNPNIVDLLNLKEKHTNYEC